MMEISVCKKVSNYFRSTISTCHEYIIAQATTQPKTKIQRTKQRNYLSTTAMTVSVQMKWLPDTRFSTTKIVPRMDRHLFLINQKSSQKLVAATIFQFKFRTKPNLFSGLFCQFSHDIHWSATLSMQRLLFGGSQFYLLNEHSFHAVGKKGSRIL